MVHLRYILPKFKFWPFLKVFNYIFCLNDSHVSCDNHNYNLFRESKIIAELKFKYFICQPNSFLTEYGSGENSHIKITIACMRHC